MDKVPYEDVKDIFQNMWCDSAEPFLHEVLWETLDKEGLTTYSNDKEYAMCLLYAYVLQMLCEEFSYMAYDEPYFYEFEVPYEEPLTEAAIGWLYRDVLSKGKYSNLDECFTAKVADMFRELIIKFRYTVADPLFQQLGEDLLGKLFFFSMAGHPLDNWEEDEETGELVEADPEPFVTKEAFLKYCQECDSFVIDALPDYNANRVTHWLYSHSCATDD